MKKRISIDELALGMFVEAQVHNEREDGEVRYFLAPVDPVYSEKTNKRARLTRRKHKQVAHSGGLLLSSSSHVEALRSTGLSVVTINTNKGADTATGVDGVVVGEHEVDAAGYADMLLGPSEPPAGQGSDDGGPSEGGSDEEDCFLEVSVTSKAANLPPAGASPTPGDARISLGADGKGWMKVETSADGRQAVLRVLSFGGDESIGLDDVTGALENHFGLRAGMDHTLIRQLVAQASKSPTHVIRGQFGVAEAEEPANVLPDNALPDNVEFSFLDGVDDAKSLSYATLKTALALESLDAIIELDPVTKSVIPGEKLAVVQHKSEEQSLLDVFGRDRGEAPELKAGEHVTVAGNNFVSDIYGYVCFLDELSVLSPIWVSTDEVEAYFIAFRQAGTASIPTRQWLQRIYDLAGITVGVRAEAIEELTAEWPATEGARAILIAQGIPVTPGEDARILCQFDTSLWPGAFLEDGSVDFRERNAFTAVERGQFLGTLQPATSGKPGKSVRGHDIEATGGADDTFDLGDNIRTDGDPPRLYAIVDGSVRARGSSLRLHEVVRIDGDVDYRMGNIEAGKDVYITGSVKPGFEVRLQGDLTVGGTIEGGATIHAGGDITVAGGIVGRDTKVVALGSVFAKFIQNASVRARGNVVSGSYLLNADVRAGGRIIVRQTGAGRGGSIVGGQTLASERVDAWTLGSASTDRTTVGIVASPETDGKMRKVGKTVEFCDQFVARAFRTLGLETIDTNQLRALIGRTPKDQRAPILTVLKQLKQATTTRARALESRAKLRTQSRRKMTGGQINVRHVAHADVEIRIADELFVLNEDLDQPVFCYSADGIQATPESSR